MAADAAPQPQPNGSGDFDQGQQTDNQHRHPNHAATYECVLPSPGSRRQELAEGHTCQADADSYNKHREGKHSDRKTVPQKNGQKYAKTENY